MQKNFSKSDIPNWYVITGGPSCGKTTIIKELAKFGYTTFPEAARISIDREIKKGKLIEEIRKDEAKFQRKVLKLNLKIAKNAPKDKIVFFDRAIPDSIAYFQICGLEPKEVLKFCQKKIHKKIFFLEQLPFERDYARIENSKTVKRLNRLLIEAYRNLGYEVIKIPAMPVKERLRKILAEIKISEN